MSHNALGIEPAARTRRGSARNGLEAREIPRPATGESPARAEGNAGNETKERGTSAGTPKKESECGKAEARKDS